MMQAKPLSLLGYFVAKGMVEAAGVEPTLSSKKS
jgi:hypothetical protein